MTRIRPLSRLLPHRDLRTDHPPGCHRFESVDAPVRAGLGGCRPSRRMVTLRGLMVLSPLVN
jgi:hypothetical protein